MPCPEGLTTLSEAVTSSSLHYRLSSSVLAKLNSISKGHGPLMRGAHLDSLKYREGKMKQMPVGK